MRCWMWSGWSDSGIWPKPEARGLCHPRRRSSAAFAARDSRSPQLCRSLHRSAPSLKNSLVGECLFTGGGRNLRGRAHSIQGDTGVMLNVDTCRPVPVHLDADLAFEAAEELQRRLLL